MDNLTLLIKRHKLGLTVVATALSAFAIFKFGECAGEFLYYILH
jgi:hypothetical protein